MCTRKRIDVRLPQQKIKLIRDYCLQTEQTFTSYLECALDFQMRRDKINEQTRCINTWGDDIEQMPLNPEHEEVENE